MIYVCRYIKLLNEVKLVPQVMCGEKIDDISSLTMRILDEFSFVELFCIFG